MSHLETTIADICAAGPCDEGIRKLLRHVGKTVTDARKDRTPMCLSVVLDSNGLNDALWVLDNTIKNRRIISLFSADCAERVHHIFAAVRPDDDRPMRAIMVARDQNATDAERAAARAAAWSAAGAAAGAAAGDAAWSAARSAARAAAWSAAGAAARAAAWDAAWAAARAAAWDAQTARLRQYIEHGEAASGMPWPEVAVSA